MKTLKCFSGCLERQCNEAVRIKESKAEIIMNSMNQWHQAPITRVVPTSGLQAEQGELPALAGRGRGLRGRGAGGRGAGAGGMGAGAGGSSSRPAGAGGQREDKDRGPRVHSLCILG